MEESTRKRFCKICKSPIKGRSDKVFCGAICKAYYHNKLKEVTNKATASTDSILHRNRSILLEIMGKNGSQIKVLKTVLEKKNFKFHYLTGFYENAQNKRYHIVYDFAWMDFKTGEILIVRRK
ncbi:hypothetical protein ES711_14010 [Gelidibacter salicanalis]|uniref:DUF2116 family Zn-ribbon domain-containing protein n=1 Tax=Gelidibacter salicanalis TaxID=291193 RepID=A0A5C7AC26_9FLAO|nr:hypothetical protein [Gelidibacter salicanalis]TXE05951.1 hypothetical protein ES711_14010 [Gelidibacter salicanalis]